MTNWDISEAISGPLDCSTVEERLAHPYWKPLGGEVKTLTDADLDALPAVQRDAILNSAATGKSISMPSGSPEGPCCINRFETESPQTPDVVMPRPPFGACPAR